MSGSVTPIHKDGKGIWTRANKNIITGRERKRERVREIKRGKIQREKDKESQRAKENQR